MKKNIEIIKKWKSLVKVNKKYTVIAFLSASIARVVGIIAPVFTANIITYLSLGKYKMATIFLVLNFSCLYLKNVLWNINYSNFPKLTGYAYLDLQSRIYDKIISANEKEIEKWPKEKLLNILHTNVLTLSSFMDVLSDKLSYLVAAIVMLVTIFIINPFVGILVCLVSICNFFVLNVINTGLAHEDGGLRDSIDCVFEKFGDVKDKRNLIDDLGVKNKDKMNYLSICGHYFEVREKYERWTSWNDNLFNIFYNFLVLIITVLIIYLMQIGSINLTLYLVVSAYLVIGIEAFIDFFKGLKELKIMGVAADRVNIILNFEDKDVINYGSDYVTNVNGFISFKNVSYKDNDKFVNKINFDILPNTFNVVVGSKNSGKRIIAQSLFRKIKPDKGNIFIDNININAFENEYYKNIVNYVSYKPEFLIGSINDNLKITGATSGNIVKVCKILNIYDDIKKLSNGFDTDIKEAVKCLKEEKVYVLSLIRALFTNSNIIILYEIPRSFDKKERKDLINIFKIISEKKTLILFTSLSDYNDVASNVIEIEKGRVIDIK
ncbi:MAG: ABC transporter ATP-binding protein [Bacilli bacterium]